MEDDQYHPLYIRINWTRDFTYYVTTDTTFGELKDAVHCRGNLKPDQQQWIPDPCCADEDLVMNQKKLINAQRVDVLLKYF